jgi:hypothetical protein
MGAPNEAGTVNLRSVPLIEAQRELVETPRGMERFEAYLSSMRGGGDLRSTR